MNKEVCKWRDVACHQLYYGAIFKPVKYLTECLNIIPESAMSEFKTELSEVVLYCPFCGRKIEILSDERYIGKEV